MKCYARHTTKLKEIANLVVAIAHISLILIILCSCYIISVKSEPVPDKGSKLVEVLERELLFLKNQIEQKDKQINSLQLLLGTSAQRPEATQSNDTPQHDETPIDQAMQHDETPYEANSNDTKQHDATNQNVTVQHEPKHGLLSRLDKGIKAFFSK